MGNLSSSGMLLQATMVASRERPRLLLDAFMAGEVSTVDMPELIAYVWLWDDEPTSEIGQAAWTSMFRSVGFFSWPRQSAQPVRPLTLLRGSTELRARGMSWTDDRRLAAQHCQRHARHGAATIYEATVALDGILAILERSDEGRTVVVDPAHLEVITCASSPP